MSAQDFIHRRDLLVSASALLCGSEWQRSIARTLGTFHPEGGRDTIDDRLVRRWATGERPIPDWVIPALTRIVESRATELSIMLVRLRSALERSDEISVMKSKTFTGKDEVDLQRQKWDWQQNHPNAAVKKTYPVESLIPNRKPIGRFAKIEAPDVVSMRVDYED